MCCFQVTAIFPGQPQQQAVICQENP